MITYEFECCKCGKLKDFMLPVDKRNELQTCECGYSMRKLIGNNGGFRLLEGGNISWGKGGYSSTYGDAKNFESK